MGSPMEKDQLETIGEYVKSHFDEWLGESSLKLVRPESEVSLSERIIRVEEGMKAQIEIFNRVSDQIEKRFEQVDKRFEQVDKRFDRVDSSIRRVNGLLAASFLTMLGGFITIVLRIGG